MKNKIGIVVILLASLTSCDDYLNLNPGYLISDQVFFKSQNDFETAMIGAYATFRGLYSTSNIQYLNDLSTDNSEIVWSSPSTDEMQFEQNAVTSTNGAIQQVWSTCLYTVARCNTILNKIDGITFDQTAKDKLKGEALTLRSLAYFYMVQFFGNVPITNIDFVSPAQVAASDLSLKPASDVYARIIPDLQQAETLLPATLNADKTRASRGTAKAILGKVYLTLKDYPNAVAKLKEVIDLNQYSLVTGATGYTSLFAEGNNNTKESIFEVEFISNQNGLGNNYSAQFTPAITSMAIFPGNLQGSGRILPTVNLLNAYESGDLRKAVVKDGIPLINGTTAPGRYTTKFVDFTITATADGNVTFTVLRYADVLLMYAEALNKNNQTLLAHDYLNPVRQRAGLPIVTGLTQDALTLQIEKDRRLEFIYEGQRWLDLKRTDRLQVVLDAYYTSKGLSFRVLPNEWILPIPIAEVQLNPTKIIQNPGY